MLCMHTPFRHRCYYHIQNPESIEAGAPDHLFPIEGAGGGATIFRTQLSPYFCGICHSVCTIDINLPNDLVSILPVFLLTVSRPSTTVAHFCGLCSVSVTTHWSGFLPLIKLRHQMGLRFICFPQGDFFWNWGVRRFPVSSCLALSDLRLPRPQCTIQFTEVIIAFV